MKKENQWFWFSFLRTTDGRLYPRATKCPPDICLNALFESHLEVLYKLKIENIWSSLWILVPLMGLEPIWFPAGFWIQCVYQFRHSGICEIYFHTISHFFLLVYNFFCKLLKFIFLIVTIYIIKYSEKREYFYCKNLKKKRGKILWIVKRWILC